MRIGNSEIDIGYCLSDYPWLWNIGMKITYEANLTDFPPKYLGFYIIWINNIKVNVDTFNTLINKVPVELLWYLWPLITGHKFVTQNK